MSESSKRLGFRPRRKYFLRESIQPVLMLKVYLMLLIVTLSSSLFFYAMGKHAVINGLFEGRLSFQSGFASMLSPLLSINILILLCAVLLVIQITHAIAGPIFRLNRLAEEAGDQGLIRQVRFRESDRMEQLEAAINGILLNWGTQLDKTVADLEDMTERLKRMSQTLGSTNEGNLGAVQQELSQVTTTCEALKAVLAEAREA
ncbi:MAG: hypothetical protein JW937_07690 [Candidatus Omnitrophica bacterium]|nr:hypothetical protein [Candidatus Omnitrophota bacterium]